MPEPLPTGPDRQPSARAVFLLRLAYWLCLLALTAHGVLWRMRSVSMPFADFDTWGYLAPALSELTGNGFRSVYGRTFLYPLLLTALLELGHSFSLIAILQQACSFLTAWLGTAVLLRCLPPGEGVTWRALLVRGLAVAFYGLAVQAVPVYFYERILRPEAVTPLLLVFLLYAAARFWLALARGRSGLGWFAAGCLANAALLGLKPNWGLAVATPVLVFGLGAFFARCSWRRLGRGLLLFVLPLGLLALAQSRVSGHAEDPVATVFLPRLLFSWHADGILPVLEADRDSGKSPYDPALLDAVARTLRQCLAAPRAVAGQVLYPSYVYNPELVMWTKTGLAATLVAQLPVDRQKDFYLHFFFRYVLTRPGHYLHKVLTQLGLYYAWNADVYKSRCIWFDGSLARMTWYSLNEYAGHPWAKVPAFATYLDMVDREKDATGAFFPCQAPIYAVLNRLYWPLAYAVLAGALVVCSRRRQRKGEGPALAEKLPLALFVTALGVCFALDLTTALTHSLDVERFFDFHFILNLLGQGLGLYLAALLLGRAAAWARRRRGSARAH